MKNGSFKLSDYSTSLYFYPNDMKDNIHYKTLDILLKALKECGFSAGIEQDTLNNYPSIAKDYFEGKRNKLAFKSHRYPNGFELKFFYDTERGQYDFDKLDKMPYITKLEFLKYIKILTNKLMELGFKDETNSEYKSPEDKIKERFVKAHWYPDIKDMNFELSDLDGTTCKDNYNNKDRDKNIIHNGDIKYFRTRNGYLQKGKVYHNINNMWWVILNDNDYTNESTFSLFSLTNEDRKDLKKIKKKKLYMNPKRKEYHNQEYRIGDNLFILNCRTRLFKAMTQYGYYEHYWDRSDNYKNNILRFNKGYILDKLAYSKTEMDFEATIKDWKETILDWRKDTSLNEEQARNLWCKIDDFDDSMSDEYICREFYDACDDEDIDCPYESFGTTTKYTDDVIRFWDLFEQFRDLLRKELELKSKI